MKKRLNKNPFAYQRMIDLKKFKINKEGCYSITKPYESKQIVDWISHITCENLGSLIITDATACNGGDTINFSHYFKYVNSVEIDIKNFKLLRENCKTFRCINVNLFIQDYTEIYNKLKQDIIYIDPPWGGVGYKNIKSVELKLGNYSLRAFVNILKDAGICRHIFIKAPLNCNINFRTDSVLTIYNKSGSPSFVLIYVNTVL